MTFEIKPQVINKQSINGLPAIIGGLQQDQANIQNTINTKQTAFTSPYKDWKIDADLDIYVALSVDGSGKTLYSNNGTSWSLPSTSGLYGMFYATATYGNGVFVAINTEGITFRSEDGYAWTVGQSLIGSLGWGWLAPTYGNGVFVAFNLVNGSIYYSLTGNTWNTTPNPAYGNSFRKPPVYANGKFVAIRVDGKTIYSVDGVNWSLGTDLSSGGGEYWISPILYGGGRFMTPRYIGNQTAYSSNGIEWNISSSSGSLEYASDIVVYGQGKFVAIQATDGKLLILSNGSSVWVNYGTLPGWGWRRPAFGTTPDYPNGIFVAVNQVGMTAFSTNGFSWSIVSGQPNNSVPEISFCKNKFVIVYSNGKLSYSSDGINWSNATIPFNPYASSSWREPPIYQKINKEKTIGQVLGI